MREPGRVGAWRLRICQRIDGGESVSAVAIAVEKRPCVPIHPHGRKSATCTTSSTDAYTRTETLSHERAECEWRERLGRKHFVPAEPQRVTREHNKGERKKSHATNTRMDSSTGHGNDARAPCNGDDSESTNAGSEPPRRNRCLKLLSASERREHTRAMHREWRRRNRDRCKQHQARYLQQLRAARHAYIGLVRRLAAAQAGGASSGAAIASVERIASCCAATPADTCAPVLPQTRVSDIGKGNEQTER